mmetsp:Transcript_59987/g.71413  ORF Transcript_59987/g.71413 Transcript_59987/m.71413 type:complete len:80 (+) Transcript_59987:392-631(+)
MSLANNADLSLIMESLVYCDEEFGWRTWFMTFIWRRRTKRYEKDNQRLLHWFRSLFLPLCVYTCFVFQFLKYQVRLKRL